MSEEAAQHAAAGPGETGIESDDLDARMILAVGLISTALLLASVLGVTALVDQFQSAEFAEKVHNKPASRSYGDGESELVSQQNSLNGYQESTAQPGTYHIPIDLAKQLVVRELSAPRAPAAGPSASDASE